LVNKGHYPKKVYIKKSFLYQTKIQLLYDIWLSFQIRECCTFGPSFARQPRSVGDGWKSRINALIETFLSFSTTLQPLKSCSVFFC
jgi:hypothetical protein